MDKKAKVQGYRYKIVPTKGEFSPIYVKTLEDVADAMRECPDVWFSVIGLRTAAEELKELGLL